MPFLAGIVAMGILSRVVHTGLVVFDKYLGDALYAAMLYTILRLRWRSASVILPAMAVMAGRQIPLNQELADILIAYRGWYKERFGAAKSDWHVFPFGKPMPNDPTRPVTTIKTAWESIRAKAKLSCRLHDLSILP